MHTAKVNCRQNGFWHRHNRQKPYVSPPSYLHQQCCFHQCFILGVFGRCPVFLHRFLYCNCISTLWSSRLRCQDFKSTDPPSGVFSFSLPLKASGLNELEHRWANNRHIQSADTTHVFVHTCKFISSVFSIVLASTCPVIEPLNFYLLQRVEVSGPQGALKSQGTSDTPCSGLISNIHVQHTTNTAPREILHKAPELWNVDFKSTPPSYCTWKQLGQKDPGFYILL